MKMNSVSIRTALIAAAIVAIGAFALLSIGGADAQQTCIQSLAGNGTVSGTWDSACLSENTPLGDYNYPSGTRYARFYTFTLSAPSDVTMELKSNSVDTYMYLMSGKGKKGKIEYYNDDIVVNENKNSRLSESLPAGDYTIEATTYDVETTGSFTLTVSGLPDASTPTVTPTSGAGETPTVTPTPISGQDTPTPTPTSTPTRTPTPASTTVPTDVLNRLSALETLAVRQQGLISTLDSKVTALDSRVATLEAGASNPTPTPTSVGTPVATATVTPTPTPTPTHTPTNIGTRGNPVPLGQYYRPGNSPWQLKVVSVNWDAWSVIQDENRFNDPPDAGNRFVLVNIEVRNLGSTAESFFAAGLNTVGSSNVEYDVECKFNVLPDRFDSFRRIFPNGVLKGNICYEVPASDTSSLLLFGDYYDFDLSFSDYRGKLWFWNLR